MEGSDYIKQMDSKLPDLFGRLPAKYDLFEMEEFRAKSAPQHIIRHPKIVHDQDISMSTLIASSRPKYTMTALALHELFRTPFTDFYRTGTKNLQSSDEN
jgi:uncharacterized protein (DUF885 family)